MTLERAEYTPPGVYWVDVPEPRTGEFNRWLRENAGTVRVLRWASPDTGATVEVFGLQLPTGNDPARVWWVLFEVLEATKWEGPGLPTIAPNGQETRMSDTVQRPVFDSGSPYALLGAGIASGVLLALLIRR